MSSCRGGFGVVSFDPMGRRTRNWYRDQGCARGKALYRVDFRVAEAGVGVFRPDGQNAPSGLLAACMVLVPINLEPTAFQSGLAGLVLERSRLFRMLSGLMVAQIN